MSAEVPRTIVLLRHAKADWPDVADHERPLAEQGRRDAPAVGEWLTARGHAPQLALCSTATRTRETWKLVAHHLRQRPRTVYEERIYDASPGELIAVLNDVDDEVRDVLVVGHNPGMEGLAGALAGRGDGDALSGLSRSGFPTAAVAVLRFTGSWKSVEPETATLTDFWAPRH
jgi:phosphohistidine phosphatase